MGLNGMLFGAGAKGAEGEEAEMDPGLMGGLGSLIQGLGIGTGFMSMGSKSAFPFLDGGMERMFGMTPGPMKKAAFGTGTERDRGMITGFMTGLFGNRAT